MSLQYIIDGYNLINYPRLAAAGRKTNSDRASLLNFIKTYRLTGSSKNKVTIVFDGYPDAGDSQIDSDIATIYSRKISADDKIRKLLEESGNKKNIVVVSNDREIQDFVKMYGATAMGIEEFIGSDKRRSQKAGEDVSEPKLTYTQMQKVNDEFRKLWLK